MLKRFLRIGNYVIRYHYWRRRAVRAERQLAAETARNREREDELITVPMRLGGLFGMPPRTGPALKQASRTAPQLTTAADPWAAISWAEQQEFDMFWKTDAASVGLSEQQARQQFMQELAQRKSPLNDDPFNVN